MLHDCVDRLDAIEAFVAAVDNGSLAGAARALRRSAPSVTRAVAALEDRLGVVLLRRSTRALVVTAAGERYLAVARRVLAELADADAAATSEREAPRGELVITAPVLFGTLHVRPVVDAYLATYRDARVRLLLLDRVVGLLDEGIDVAVRIAHLPDSALVAKQVGTVRRVACASPAYLKRHGEPREPSELARHRCISNAGVTPSDTWTFGKRDGRTRHVAVQPVLVANTAEAAIGSAMAGNGVTCALSYQVAAAMTARQLVPILVRHEPAPLPVHIVYAAGAASTAKLRAFVDIAVPALRAAITDST
jgi:DNA-binding transcriptional LysR family regulator